MKTETYESYIEQLEYRNYAIFVARNLKSGKSCVIGYAPRNGTNYTLVFTPVKVDPSAEFDWTRAGYKGALPNWGYPEGMTGITKKMLSDNQIWAYIGWLNHGCYLFRMDGFNHWSYIAEKFSINDHARGDVYALAALFEQIGRELPTFDEKGIYHAY